MMKLKRLMVFAVLVAVLFSGLTVMAEEETLYEGWVELYHEGGLPNTAYMPVAMFRMNTFDSYILEQLKAQKDKIDVSKYELSPNDFATMYWRLLNANPDMFYVSGAYRYYMKADYVSSFLPEYIYEGNELTQMRSVYNSGVNAIVNYALGANTKVGQMLRANDYMCANYQYDLSYSIYSPELFFKNGKGVCQAYMLVYRAVLNRLGIQNLSVTSDEINHTWNMVNLDGSWYHIDVTWNDPIQDVPLRACHNNFLLSDAGITNTGHYGWDDGYESVPSANNTKYDNYFWKKIVQVTPMKGDVVYYVDSDYTTTYRTVYSHNLANGSVSKINTYDYGYGTYYKDYNPIWVNGYTLYYAVRDSLYRMPLGGGTAEKIYSTGNSQWLWYPYLTGKTLKIFGSSKPSGTGKIHTIDLSSVCTAHVPVVINGVQATCTQDGLTEGSYCSACGETLVQQVIITAPGHKPVTDAEVPATCTSRGLTEGSHCEVCGEMLKTQDEIPALGHTEELVPGKAATCTETGLTDGKKCSVCEAILVAQEIVPAFEHTPIAIPGKDATDEEDGLTEGSQCSVCGAILVAQEVIPMVKHTVVKDEAVMPTCTQNGLTEGSHCSVCGKILVAQEVIPADGHDGEWVVVTEATSETEGLKELRCTVCEEVLESVTIPKLEEENERVPGDVDGDGVRSARDLLRMAKYVGGYSVEINAANADVNADGLVDARDLLRLAKVLGGYDEGLLQ